MSKFSATRLDIGGCVVGDLDLYLDVAKVSRFVKKAIDDKAKVIFWVDEVRSMIRFDEDGDMIVKTTPEVLKVLNALT